MTKAFETMALVYEPLHQTSFFIFFGFSRFNYVEIATDLYVWSNPDKPNRR